MLSHIQEGQWRVSGFARFSTSTGGVWGRKRLNTNCGIFGQEFFRAEREIMECFMLTDDNAIYASKMRIRSRLNLLSALTHI